MKLDGVPSVELLIRCGGTALPEYVGDADNQEGTRTGVRYIEAKSESNFTVYFKADKYENGKWSHIGCDIKLDGKSVNHALLEVQTSRHYQNEMRGAYGLDGDQEVLRRFKFADLATNDGDADGTKIADFKHLGEIEINLRSCRKLAPTIREHHIASIAESSIPEKALKGRAISNRATLDKAEPVRLTTPWTVEYEDHQYKPFAKYIFKYRSRRNLQIEGLIPRSPSPVPLEERDVDELTPDEMRELLRRKHTQENKKDVKVKKEKRSRAVEEDEDEEVTITEEPNSKRTRLSTDSGIEVVDLTDD